MNAIHPGGCPDVRHAARDPERDRNQITWPADGCHSPRLVGPAGFAPARPGPAGPGVGVAAVAGPGPGTRGPLTMPADGRPSAEAGIGAASSGPKSVSLHHITSDSIRRPRPGGSPPARSAGADCAGRGSTGRIGPIDRGRRGRRGTGCGGAARSPHRQAARHRRRSPRIPLPAGRRSSNGRTVAARYRVRGDRGDVVLIFLFFPGDITYGAHRSPTGGSTTWDETTRVSWRPVPARDGCGRCEAMCCSIRSWPSSRRRTARTTSVASGPATQAKEGGAEVIKGVEITTHKHE